MATVCLDPGRNKRRMGPAQQYVVTKARLWSVGKQQLDSSTNSLRGRTRATIESNHKAGENLYITHQIIYRYPFVGSMSHVEDLFPYSGV